MMPRREVEPTYRVLDEVNDGALKSLGPEDREFLKMYMETVAKAFADIDRRLNKIERIMRVISIEYTPD